jgi:hypothetical protein
MIMNGMMLHRGALEVKRSDLDLVPLPEATDSYTPVSHYHLTDRLLTISNDILTDYCLVGEKYALARQGQQMFAFLQFKREEAELGLCLAFRNSYDRSMSVGMAIGASVFICDNLALTGDIAVMRKHTKNIWTTNDPGCSRPDAGDHLFRRRCILFFGNSLRQGHHKPAPALRGPGRMAATKP